MRNHSEKHTVPFTEQNTQKRGAKLLALCLCLIMASSMLLAGCGGGEDGPGSTGTSAGSNDTNIDTGSDTSSDGGTDDGAGSGDAAIEDEIEGIPVGTWQDSYMISERDDKPYPVKIRIKSVDTEQKDVQEQIDAYNVSASGHTIPALDDDAYMYVIAHYEVEFPSDYPDGDFGITSVAPAFMITAADGSDVITTDGVNYNGLTQTFEIGSLPQGYDFHAGSTYQGAIVYLMVNGYTNYRILEAAETPDGGVEQHYYLAK